MLLCRSQKWNEFYFLWDHVSVHPWCSAVLRCSSIFVVRNYTSKGLDKIMITFSLLFLPIFLIPTILSFRWRRRFLWHIRQGQSGKKETRPQEKERNKEERQREGRQDGQGTKAQKNCMWQLLPFDLMQFPNTYKVRCNVSALFLRRVT